MELWLEVDLDDEPIRGVLRLPNEVSFPFLGWLGLTVALDRLLKRRNLAIKEAR